MPIYLDPRVIEGSLYTLDNNVKQHAITTLINGMEVAVLEHRLQDTVKEMKNLSVAFNTFKKDIEHSLMQHLLPRQVGGRSCECPHHYFCSGGRNRPSSVGGLERGSVFAVRCNTPFARSPDSTGSSSTAADTESESDILPPLEEVSPESGCSEEEKSDGSKSEEDWQSAGEEGSDLGGFGVNSEGSGGDTWELFGVSGVRRDSV
jgi:hypothetical protein